MYVTCRVLLSDDVSSQRARAFMCSTQMTPSWLIQMKQDLNRLSKTWRIQSKPHSRQMSLTSRESLLRGNKMAQSTSLNPISLTALSKNWVSWVRMSKTNQLLPLPAHFWVVTRTAQNLVSISTTDKSSASSTTLRKSTRPDMHSLCFTPVCQVLCIPPQDNHMQMQSNGWGATWEWPRTRMILDPKGNLMSMWMLTLLEIVIVIKPVKKATLQGEGMDTSSCMQVVQSLRHHNCRPRLH